MSVTIPEFRSVDVPETTRESKPNPFIPLVKDMIEKGGARQFDLPKKNDDDEKALNSAITQIQNAGRALNVTVRKLIKTNNGIATITVWTVPKISRPGAGKRKDDETANDTASNEKVEKKAK